MDGNNITVAICVKNGEKTIAAAVRSICAQDVPPKRLIIIDDGSTDNTRKEVEKASSGSCPVIVAANEGKGLYDGRNTALKLCDTEFLAFIDADCEADSGWTKGILSVFQAHPEVAAGTGAHPQTGEANWVSRLHRFWFVVDSHRGKKYIDGVIGANSYFRTAILREVGGWISVPLGNAEDMYISVILARAGHKMWFDEDLKVYHHYTRGFFDFLLKCRNSGYAIIVMMKAAGWRNYWYYYSLGIPLVALATIFFALLGVTGHSIGWFLLGGILCGTFYFNLRMFGSFRKTLPRWAVRWIIIWPYSLGVFKAAVGGPSVKKSGR